MKKRKFLLILVSLLLFLLALSRLDAGHRQQGRQQLEEALRRTAVSCYALEGFYPPSLEDLKSRYGLRYDERRYTVHYEVFASNLMPDITVMEKER